MLSPRRETSNYCRTQQLPRLLDFARLADCIFRILPIPPIEGPSTLKDISEDTVDIRLAPGNPPSPGFDLLRCADEPDASRRRVRTELFEITDDPGVGSFEVFNGPGFAKLPDRSPFGVLLVLISISFVSSFCAAWVRGVG